MTKEEILEEIKSMRDHYLGIKEDIELKSIRLIKDKEKLDIWDFNYLSSCCSDLNMILIKLKLIEDILKLFKGDKNV